MTTTLAPPLDGVAFEVPDLLLAQAWAAFHGLRMTIELESRDGRNPAEEVLAFHAETDTMARWLIWCDAETIVVQPATGTEIRFETLADALECLMPERTERVTDISAP
jgi:hypothetical protein